MDCKKLLSANFRHRPPRTLTELFPYWSNDMGKIYFRKLEMSPGDWSISLMSCSLNVMSFLQSREVMRESIKQMFIVHPTDSMPLWISSFIFILHKIYVNIYMYMYKCIKRVLISRAHLRRVWTVQRAYNCNISFRWARVRIRGLMCSVEAAVAEHAVALETDMPKEKTSGSSSRERGREKQSKRCVINESHRKEPLH